MARSTGSAASGPRAGRCGHAGASHDSADLQLRSAARRRAPPAILPRTRPLLRSCDAPRGGSVCGTVRSQITLVWGTHGVKKRRWTTAAGRTTMNCGIGERGVAMSVVARRKLSRIHGAVSKGAQAYEQIKQAILHAQFRPGEVLSIRTLAASFGISTMPVREAVTRLITEKGLELLPNRGLRVPNLSDEEARDVLRARFVLEGLAVELAAARITSAEIAALEECERESEA